MTTSESVGIGHPDKAADQISDAILDAYLSQDKNARTAIEVLIKDSTVIIAGEVNSTGTIDHTSVALEVLNRLYTGPTLGSGGVDWHVIDVVGTQSADIALGTDIGGAGDQGTVVGYANSNESTFYLPEAYWHATELARRVNDYRKHGTVGSDFKTQVTLSDTEPGLVDAVLISAQSNQGIDELRQALISDVIDPYFDEHSLVVDSILVNPTGSFTVGGPWGDAGLTGRKTQVDSYGGLALHGGGAFSGKDATKVDRSGAYMARYAALWAVQRYNLSSVTISASYAIGVKGPVDIKIELPNGAPQIVAMDAYRILSTSGCWSPERIAEHFDLQNFGRYQDTATFGHFTDSSYPWNQITDTL